jgi:hypothetical protein
MLLFKSVLEGWFKGVSLVVFVMLLAPVAETEFGVKAMLLLLGPVVCNPTAANGSVWIISSSLVLSTADRAVGAAMGFGPAASVTLLLLDSKGSAACLKPREVL